MTFSDEDINLAAQVHYSFMPKAYSNDYVEIAVTAKPHGRVGGDYCSILPVDERNVIACVCDAVGHGLASALFAARINTFVLTHALQEHDPCNLISLLNKHLCQRLADIGMYASFTAVHLDFEENIIEFAGAAHPPAIHYRSDIDAIQLLSSETTLLGIHHPLPAACASHRRQLGSGDRIILYTDGLTDARSSQGSFYGAQRLESFVKTNPALSSPAFNAALVQEVTDYAEDQLTDDLLLMSISVK